MFDQQRNRGQDPLARGVQSCAAMNYYEELGLTKSATTEEIRQAYKILARLLHPDQHRDEKLRLLAECQMKRLNEIIGVLTDRKRRSQYEASLEGETEARNKAAVPIVIVAPPSESRDRWPFRGSASTNWAWVLIAAIALGSILWYLGSERGRETLVRPGSPAVGRLMGRPEPETAAGGTSESLRRRRKPQAREAPESQGNRESAQPGSDAAPGIRAGAGQETLAAAAGRTPAVAPPSSAVAAPPRQALLAAEHVVVSQRLPAPLRGSFSGNWFCSSSRIETSPEDFYPAEYAELVVREEAGALGGRYRARYRVADRAISPEVVFHFEGRVSQDSARLQWTGGGAKGEARLQLLSPDSMEITWWATDLGRAVGLASGTAVLTRRQEP